VADYLKLRWTAGPQMEAHLQSLGVKFEVRRSRPSAFDVDGSRKLQTRLDLHVNENYATDLAADIERTKCIERLVCIPAPVGKLLLICDGIHRQFGVEQLLVDLLPPDFEYEYYYVETYDPKIRDLVSRTCNCVGDKLSVSHEVRVVHIRYMMSEYNMSLKDVAIHFHENPETIRSELFTDEQRKELLANDVKGADWLTPSHIKEIAKIKANDRLKFQIARVACQYKPTVKQVKQAVDGVLKAVKTDSEAAAMGVIGDFKKDLQNASAASAKVPAKGKRAPQRKKAFDLIGDLYRFVSLGIGDGKPFTNLKQVDITDPHDAHNFREQWKATKKIVDTMCHHG